MLISATTATAHQWHAPRCATRPGALLRWSTAAAGDWCGDCPPARPRFLAGFRFPREVISVAVRWYLRYGLSYRDIEELLAERGITVDHVTVYRWVQRFTPEFIEAARPGRHVPGNRWFVDETYLKVAGQADLSLPGGRSAWPGHRRPAVGQARPGGRPALLRPGAARRHDPGRGHHRPRRRLPAGARRADPLGAAHRGAVREQPDRGRPRAAESPAPADAGPETAPVSAGPRRRSRVRAEPAPRPLRHRCRSPRATTGSALPSTTSQLPSDPRRTQVITP